MLNRASALSRGTVSVNHNPKQTFHSKTFQRFSYFVTGVYMCSLGRVRSVARLLYCHLFNIIRCLVINTLTHIIQKQKKKKNVSLCTLYMTEVIVHDLS